MIISIDIGGTNTRVAISTAKNVKALVKNNKEVTEKQLLQALDNLNSKNLEISNNKKKAISSSSKNPVAELLLDFTKFPTPKNKKDLLKKIYGFIDGYMVQNSLTKSSVTKDAVKKLTSLKPNKQKVQNISLGIAGPVDQKTKKLLRGTNIKALQDGLEAKEFEKRYKCPVEISNDGVLAGLAEATVGQGRDYRSVAYVTISTGVGGSLIVDKEIPHTRFNSEIGHHIIEIGGQQGRSTKIQGEWEAYSSGPAFESIYGLKPEDCDSLEIWDEYAQDLAIGLHNITVMWSPEVIVLGGGLSAKWEYFMTPLQRYLDKSLNSVFPTPAIKISKLGNLNGVLGGMVRVS